MAGIVRHAVRKIADCRRKYYGEVLQPKMWRPVLAAVLLMADDGKYSIRRSGVKTVLTWPGLTNYSLCLNLLQIGIETELDDPAIEQNVDDAYRRFGTRQVTRAELGQMLELTSAKRIEFKVWQILPRVAEYG